MNMRLLLVFFAFAPLMGCISLPDGRTTLLLTPIGVLGVHSFTVPRTPDNVELKESVGAVTADAGR